MSAVFLDPVGMDATASAVTTHGSEVEALAQGLESLGVGSAPPSLAAWLADELGEIALTARMAALVYLLAALDTMTRAEAIRTNQSLVTAIPAVGAVTPAFADTGFVLGAVEPAPDPFTSGAATGGFLLGQVEPATYVPTSGEGYFLGASPSAGAVSMPGLSTEAFLANNPLLRAAGNLQATNPGAAAQLFGLHGFMSSSSADMIGVWTNSRPGASYVGSGLYRGNDGSIGSISDVYRNPDRPGEFLVD